MRILTKKERVPCTVCLGYGELSSKSGTWKSIPCSLCNSIHANYLGMSYLNGDYGYTHPFMYLKPTLFETIKKMLGEK